MDQWDDLRFVLALHRNKTMSAAGTALGTNVATVSRRIERLSERLGSPLFIKTGNGWEATNAAVSLISAIDEFEARLARETNNFSNGQTDHFIDIRVAAPPFINAAVLAVQTGAFLKQNPKIRLELDDKVQSQGLGDADLYIKFGRPERGRIVARRVANMMFRPYVLRNSTNKDKGWVSLTPRFDQVPQSRLGFQVFKVEPTFRVDSFEHEIAIMRATGLPGILPEVATANGDEFEEVPFEGEPHDAECWLGYHQSRRADQSVQAVAKWILESFQAAQFKIAEDPEVEL